MSYQTIQLQAEEAHQVGTLVRSERPGYSGRGYVAGFDQDGDRIEFEFPASAGVYEVRIRYRSSFGEKGFDMTVNKARVSGMFPKTGEVFALHSAGKVELKAGNNTLTIEKGWGYYEIDSVELVPASAAPLPRKPSKTPVDPRATSQARVLLSYLVDRYGATMLSGQYNQPECAYIQTITGKFPAVYGDDLMDYSPSRVARSSRPKDLTERCIQAAKNGSILTLSWHWNAPTGLLDKTYTGSDGKTINAQWYKGFYTNATTFDVQRALANPNSEDYRLLLRDMDTIAVELKKLAAAKVPVLWRPLHEAEGGWFWWGAKGPEPFKALWRLLYKHLTEKHNLHNLLWVYTGIKPDWYPGDTLVDIVGIDAYPSSPADPLSGDWDSLLRRFDGKKLLALTEFGGVPDVERLRRFGVRWSYFVSWVGDLGPKKMSNTDLTRIYRSTTVTNRSDLADYRKRLAQGATNG